LHQLIATYDDLSVVGEAVNGKEAVLLAAALKPAVVVMDVHLPVLSGRAATHIDHSGPASGGRLRHDRQELMRMRLFPESSV
jgi:CheY-like chemotaxis protein